MKHTKGLKGLKIMKIKDDRKKKGRKRSYLFSFTIFASFNSSPFLLFMSQRISLSSFAIDQLLLWRFWAVYVGFIRKRWFEIEINCQMFSFATFFFPLNVPKNFKKSKISLRLCGIEREITAKDFFLIVVRNFKVYWNFFHKKHMKLFQTVAFWLRKDLLEYLHNLTICGSLLKIIF